MLSSGPGVDLVIKFVAASQLVREGFNNPRYGNFPLRGRGGTLPPFYLEKIGPKTVFFLSKKCSFLREKTANTPLTESVCDWGY